MFGIAIVRIKGPFPTVVEAERMMPKEANVTKVKPFRPVYDNCERVVAFDFKVFYDYNESDKSAIKKWGDKHDYSRR